MRALVEREGGLDLKRATRLVLQIARALAEAHARGIVHKNLKSENVFVSGKSGEPDFVKLLDFGFASPAPGPRGHEGTPAADVYALGALFFLLLTGETVAEAEALGQRERVPSPSARLGAALPDRLESVIVRCLESDPSERFRDARELAATIDACLPLLDPAGLALGEVPRALARSGRAAFERRAGTGATRPTCRTKTTSSGCCVRDRWGGRYGYSHLALGTNGSR